MAGPLITLAGKSYSLPEKFVLRQLRDISSISVRTVPDSASEKEIFFCAQSVDMIEVALRRTETPLKADDIMDSETDISEIFTARKIILEHTGLQAKGDPKPGEGEAEAPRT